jgi:hypothetical protein
MNIFKRKIKSEDLTPSEMPSSRPALFWDILKNNFRPLLGISLLLLAFSLPLLVNLAFLNFEKYYLGTKLSAGTLAQSDYDIQASYLSNLFLLLNPIAVSIFALGLSGVLRIIKRLCYLEPVFFWDDFRKGFKQNAFPTWVNLFFLSVLFSLTFFVHALNPDNILLDIPLGLFVMMVYPVSLYLLIIQSVYEIRITNAIILAYKIYFRSFLQTLPLLLAFIAPFFFEYIPDLLVKFITLPLFLLLFAPIYFISLFLFVSSLLDKYVNKKEYPVLYRKGLYTPDEKDFKN